MENMEHFLQIYGALPRAGPGGNIHTKRAFEMCKGLPEEPRILDIGCGPGMQTVEVARLSGGTITAIDIFPCMLARLTKLAHDSGLDDRIDPLQMDMNEMNFQPKSFDLVWSEGAIYFLGFRNGLKRVKEMLRPGGCVAVSESVWLKKDPPKVVQDFWAEYPEIDTVDAKLAVIEELGYELLGHFVLPPEAWTDDYYDPMKVRLEEMTAVWKDDRAGLDVIHDAWAEIEVFEKHHDYFSYGFFVMRK